MTIVPNFHFTLLAIGSRLKLSTTGRQTTSTFSSLVPLLARYYLTKILTETHAFQAEAHLTIIEYVELR